MKTVLKAGIVLVFAIVSMFVILNADDSDAEIFVQEKNVVINGLYYDLCTNDANHSDYGSYGDHIAFVSGGSGSPNSKYAESELVIPSAVEHSGVTYKVVGIRNNAFQANMGGEPWPLLNLTKVTFPETIVAIGVDNKYNPSTTGSCFSKCYNLNEIAIEGMNPQLKHISGNAFGNSAIEVLDLSQCHDLSIMNNAFGASDIISQLKKVDIRNAVRVSSYAFDNAVNIQEIVMPMGSATIEANAFDLEFYDSGGNLITDMSKLIGKSFKRDESVMKQGHLATFDTNGGSTLASTVLFTNDPLPTDVTKTDCTFYTWSGSDEMKMPDHDATFTAIWATSITAPIPASYTYDGEDHTPYHDTGGYTVSGDVTRKNAGNNYTTILTLRAGTVWADTHTNEPRNIAWTIQKKAVTVKGITADGKEYDGNTNAVLDFDDAEFDGLEYGDHLTVTATGTFEDKNVGGKNVSITNMVLGGESVGNYRLADSGCQDHTTADIAHKEVTIIVDNHAKYVGNADPAFTATVTGMIEGESLTYTVTRADGEAVGQYAITANVTQNEVSANYDIDIDDGVFTISNKHIIITAKNVSKVYGSPDPDLSGYDLVDTLGTGIVRGCTMTRVASENVGQYAITITNVDTTYDLNDIELVAGKLMIVHKTIFVKADHATKVYGSNDPTLTATPTGLLPGDSVNYTLARVAGENVGEYDIVVTGDELQGNYEVVFSTGHLVITPKTVTVKANDASKIHWQADPALTATVTGLVGGDTVVYELSRDGGEDIGTYGIYAKGHALQGNYHVVFKNGTFTVESDLYTITIVINGKAKVISSYDRCLAGTHVSLFNYPGEGWRFVGYSSEDVVIEDGSFIMPSKDVVIEATFEGKPATEMVYTSVGAVAALAAAIMIAPMFAKKP